MMSYDAWKVWAAAAAATRINGGYFKEDKSYFDFELEKSVTLHVANKTLVLDMLRNDGGWTDEDIEEGRQAREHWQGGIIKILSDSANPFEKTAISISNKDVIDSFYDIAVLGSLIASYHRAVKVEKIRELKGNSKLIGKIGENLAVEGAVISSHYSQEYKKCRNELLTNDGNVVCWWGAALTSPRVAIRGKVKSHRIERNGSNVTQLNYVKIVS